ncbi:hypothetical protein ACFWGR_11685 [Streptomyces sp. NPDC060311]|uniref:hypothetical protein n=1 Tax=Streptomyces sp. NPDC060311 TaxID=3347096 RepID=UPI003652FF2F
MSVHLFNAVAGAGSSIDAVSQEDAWAVGLYEESRGAFLTQHWDGEAWHLVPVPDATSLWTYSVTALADDVWAAGRKLVDDEDPGHALHAHWDGRSWKQCRPPPTRVA